MSYFQFSSRKVNIEVSGGLYLFIVDADRSHRSSAWKRMFLDAKYVTWHLIWGVTQYSGGFKDRIEHACVYLKLLQEATPQKAWVWKCSGEPCRVVLQSSREVNIGWIAIWFTTYWFCASKQSNARWNYHLTRSLKTTKSVFLKNGIRRYLTHDILNSTHWDPASIVKLLIRCCVSLYIVCDIYPRTFRTLRPSISYNCVI